MTDDSWRPFGVNSDEAVASYDALHDGVPEWMSSAFWAWVREGISVDDKYHVPSMYGSGSYYSFTRLNVDLAEEMSQRLKIRFPNLREPATSPSQGSARLDSAMKALVVHENPLQIADYLLAHGGNAKADDLLALLDRSKSAYTVGERASKPGLVPRVPVGVQVAADSVIARAGRAGIRLAKAWEELYGLEPNPSEAYRQSILAVEDAVVPVVSPKNTGATLGTVLKQIEDQGDWQLPMDREHKDAPSRVVVVGMLRMLWHGQHDRHGGQPSAPGNVSEAEAKVAVSLAVSLVNLFAAGLVERSNP